MRWFGHNRALRGAAILVYHRIRDTLVDPLGMSVSPHRFAEHLRVLRASGRPLLSLSELAARHAEGTTPRGAVAVTFDDGYRDAAVAAAGLAEHDVPATFFVTTAAIGADGMWWDDMASALLSAGDVRPFEITAHGQRYAVDPGPGIDPAAHPDWRVSTQPHPSARHAAFKRLWTLLLCATAEERAAAVEVVDEAAGAREPRTRSMLDADELAALESSAPVTIGSHTVSHLSLVRTEHRARTVELDAARDALAAILGHQIDEIAYPHGHVDADIAAAARRAGHTVGVARGNANVPRDATVMRLPRYEVGDWTGDELERRLAAWA